MENNPSKEDNKEGTLKPDKETLHTTDPQEHMEGPLSSLVKEAGAEFESDENADGKKEESEK
jgi:hypothetical protein